MCMCVKTPALYKSHTLHIRIKYLYISEEYNARQDR